MRMDISIAANGFMSHTFIPLLFLFDEITVYEWARGSGDFTMLGTQLIGVLFVFAWTFVIMGIFFSILKVLGWFRIDPLEEEVGMDISRHKGGAYDMGMPLEEAINELNNSRHSRGSFKKGVTLEHKDAMAVVEAEERA
jgi:hypothetical protein